VSNLAKMIDHLTLTGAEKAIVRGLLRLYQRVDGNTVEWRTAHAHREAVAQELEWLENETDPQDFASLTTKVEHEP
jgi:hypothetical protein